MKGYCKTWFDKESLEFFLENLSRIDNSLNKGMIMRIICDYAKHGKLSIERFFTFLEMHFIYENEEYSMPYIF